MNQTPVWLRRFSTFVAVSTLFLIFAGAMVTSTGSGLAVPDWPLNYGRLYPPLVGGILYETGHRYAASVVGFLTVLQAVLFWRFSANRIAKKLAWSSVGAVIVQGILGGMTVLFLQPHALSVAHGAVAEIFLCLNVSTAFAARRDGLGTRPVPPLFASLTAVLYAQILLGAWMRHLGAGLAIPDFPLSLGRVIPPITSVSIAANFAHRLGAVVVTAFVIAAAVQCFRSGIRQLRTLATLLVALVGVQAWLGATVVLHGAESIRDYHSLAGTFAMTQALITSLHVVTGASMLATSLLIALTSRVAARQEVPSPAGAFVASEVTA